MQKPDIVVVGTSAGGVEALLVLAEKLPEDYPGTICLDQAAGCRRFTQEAGPLMEISIRVP